MKTTKFTIKNQKGINTSDINFPDIYEKVFEKYSLEAYEFSGLFGETIVNFYFRNKETNLDEGSFVLNICNSRIETEKMFEVMQKMLEKCGDKIE